MQEIVWRGFIIKGYTRAVSQAIAQMFRQSD